MKSCSGEMLVLAMRAREAFSTFTPVPPLCAMRVLTTFILLPEVGSPTCRP